MHVKEFFYFLIILTSFLFTLTNQLPFPDNGEDFDFDDVNKFFEDSVAGFGKKNGDGANSAADNYDIEGEYYDADLGEKDYVENSDSRSSNSPVSSEHIIDSSNDESSEVHNSIENSTNIDQDGDENSEPQDSDTKKKLLDVVPVIKEIVNTNPANEETRGSDTEPDDSDTEPDDSKTSVGSRKRYYSPYRPILLRVGARIVERGLTFMENARIVMKTLGEFMRKRRILTRNTYRQLVRDFSKTFNRYNDDRRGVGRRRKRPRSQYMPLTTGLNFLKKIGVGTFENFEDFATNVEKNLNYFGND